MRDAAKSLCVAAVLLLGCQAEEELPPDPNTPLDPVECDEAAPLTLLRSAPDSRLGAPPWLQLCNVCPASFDLTVPDLDLVTAWSDDGSCAVAMPTAPWPAVDEHLASAHVDTGSRSATFDFVHPGTGSRGEDPDELGSGTFRLSMTADDLRVPGLEPDGGDLLVRFEPTADHGFAVHFGRAEGSSNTQDLCVPTTTLQSAARIDRRQLGVPLLQGDVVPLPFAAPVAEGAFQATLSSSGSAISASAMLLDIDARLLEGDADTICADYEALAGSPLCGPCGDPASEPDGNTCLTFVWEWSTAIRVPDPLVHVDAPTPDCADPS